MSETTSFCFSVRFEVGALHPMRRYVRVSPRAYRQRDGAQDDWLRDTELCAGFERTEAFFTVLSALCFPFQSQQRRQR